MKNGQYEEIGGFIGALVDKQNRTFMQSFRRTGDILRILYPHGIRPDQYEDLLAQVRIIDQQFQIAAQKSAASENPWQHIAGYGLLKCRDIDMGRANEGSADLSQ